MGQRAAWERGVKTRCACTGSKPPWLNGLQRSRRQPASTSPRSMPNSRNRLDGVLRAARRVLAARRQQRGDHAAVDHDRSDGDRGAQQSSPLPRRLVDELGDRRAHAAEALALDELQRVRAARRSRRRRPAAAARPPRGTPRAGAASRDCGRPRRPPCATRRRPGAGPRLHVPRAGTRAARSSGSRGTGPGGRRARTRRCATGGRASPAGVQRSGTAPRPRRGARR